MRNKKAARYGTLKQARQNGSKHKTNRKPKTTKNKTKQKEKYKIPIARNQWPAFFFSYEIRDHSSIIFSKWHPNWSQDIAATSVKSVVRSLLVLEKAFVRHASFAIIFLVATVLVSSLFLHTLGLFRFFSPFVFSPLFCTLFSLFSVLFCVRCFLLFVSDIIFDCLLLLLRFFVLVLFFSVGFSCCLPICCVSSLLFCNSISILSSFFPCRPLS